MPGEFQVGDVRIRPDLLRFERDGQTVAVEPKVMDALVYLASRPGETVTRAAMMAELWPDLHVTEDALNRCIWKLRRALADDPSAPRYVATVQKRGYRLVAEVTWSAPPANPAPPSTRRLEQVPGRPSDAQALQQAADSEPPRRWSRGLAIGLVAILGALTIMGGRTMWSRESGAPAAGPPTTAVPFTSLDGYESAPAISPDGRSVVFVHNSHGGAHANQLDLHMQPTDGSAAPVAVTQTAANEFSPAWSPDGARLAFSRRDEERCDVVVLTMASHAESIVTGCDPAVRPGLAWSPRGDALLLAERGDSGGPSRIVRYSLSDGSRTVLTAPPHQDMGDTGPAVSPDGRQMAFIRTRTGDLSDVHVVFIDGGSARRLTFDASGIGGLTWSADGREIVYASNRLGPYRLWSVPVGGGTPRLVPAVGSNASSPAATTRGPMLVYEEWKSTIDVRRATLVDSGSEDLPYDAKPLVTSTQWDTEARWSPDGTRLAFLSDRQGSTDVWLASGDGAEPRRLTSFGIRFSSWLRWSPDGTRVALSVPIGEQFDIQVLDATSGALQRVTSDASDERWPAWSSDGRALYFGSNRDGRWQIWRSSVAGGSATAVTTAGGLAPALSDDGAWLYYVKADAPGLWRQSLAGDPAEQRVIESAQPGQVSWDLHQGAVYLVETPASGLPSLFRYDLTTNARRMVARLALADGQYPEWFPSGIAVSRDGRSVAFGSIEQSGSDLWLMQPPPR